MTSSNGGGPRKGRRNLYARLAELESIHEQIRRAAKVRSDKANSETLLENFRLLLRAYGFEQSPTESFFETLARALGIGTRELKDQLQNGTFNATILKWVAAREAEIEGACRISEAEAERAG
jgi:hypothetical protein